MPGNVNLPGRIWYNTIGMCTVPYPARYPSSLGGGTPGLLSYFLYFSDESILQYS